MCGRSTVKGWCCLVTWKPAILKPCRRRSFGRKCARLCAKVRLAKDAAIIYLGYGLAHYADFYDLKHVLILGRVTSGIGGELILENAKQVLWNEFPEVAARFQVQLPDEKSRRVGQSIAAASLPALS